MSLAQQKLLYKAESCLWGHGREFSNHLEATVYLDSVIMSEWFIKQFGLMPQIKVQPARFKGFAGAADRNTFTIYLKRCNENVVLHELAHLISPTDDHDHMFVNNFQYLIRHAMGFYAYAEFTFELQKVEYYDA